MPSIHILLLITNVVEVCHKFNPLAEVTIEVDGATALVHEALRLDFLDHTERCLEELVCGVEGDLEHLLGFSVVDLIEEVEKSGV